MVMAKVFPCHLIYSVEKPIDEFEIVIGNLKWKEANIYRVRLNGA